MFEEPRNIRGLVGEIAVQRDQALIAVFIGPVNPVEMGAADPLLAGAVDYR